jgi:hypothetical protein
MRVSKIRPNWAPFPFPLPEKARKIEIFLSDRKYAQIELCLPKYGIKPSLSKATKGLLFGSFLAPILPHQD